METNRIFKALKIRQIEKEIITLFPIIQIILGFSILINSLITGGSNALEVKHWDGFLIAGAFLGLFFRTNFYIYYFGVSLPLQIFAGEVYRIYAQAQNGLIFNLAILLIALAIASSIFAGKVIPRGPTNGSRNNTVSPG